MPENRWDDDEQWGAKLPDDPESVERRAEAQTAIRASAQRVLRWVYLALAVLIAVVIIVATR